MSQIRQSDARNHLSPRFRTKIHLCDPVSQPDATGYSVPEPDAIKTDPTTFALDFVAEHSSPSEAATPGDHLPGSFRPEAPAISKMGASFPTVWIRSVSPAANTGTF